MGHDLSIREDLSEVLRHDMDQLSLHLCYTIHLLLSEISCHPTKTVLKFVSNRVFLSQEKGCSAITLQSKISLPNRLVTYEIK